MGCGQVSGNFFFSMLDMIVRSTNRATLALVVLAVSCSATFAGPVKLAVSVKGAYGGQSVDFAVNEETIYDPLAVDLAGYPFTGSAQALAMGSNLFARSTTSNNGNFGGGLGVDASASGMRIMLSNLNNLRKPTVDGTLEYIDSLSPWDVQMRHAATVNPVSPSSDNGARMGFGISATTYLAPGFATAYTVVSGAATFQTAANGLHMLTQLQGELLNNVADIDGTGGDTIVPVILLLKSVGLGEDIVFPDQFVEFGMSIFVNTANVNAQTSASINVLPTLKTLNDPIARYRHITAGPLASAGVGAGIDEFVEIPYSELGITVVFAPVPEPGSLLLLSVGATCIASYFASRATGLASRKIRI